MNWTGGKRANHTRGGQGNAIVKKQKGFFAKQRQQNAQAGRSFGDGGQVEGLSHAKFTERQGENAGGSGRGGFGGGHGMLGLGRGQESGRIGQGIEGETTGQVVGDSRADPITNTSGARGGNHAGTTEIDEAEYILRKLQAKGGFPTKTTGSIASSAFAVGGNESSRTKDALRHANGATSMADKKKLLLQQDWLSNPATPSLSELREKGVQKFEDIRSMSSSSRGMNPPPLQRPVPQRNHIQSRARDIREFENDNPPPQQRFFNRADTVGAASQVSQSLILEVGDRSYIKHSGQKRGHEDAFDSHADENTTEYAPTKRSRSEQNDEDAQYLNGINSQDFMDMDLDPGYETAKTEIRQIMRPAPASVIYEHDSFEELESEILQLNSSLNEDAPESILEDSYASGSRQGWPSRRVEYQATVGTGQENTDAASLFAVSDINTDTRGARDIQPVGRNSGGYSTKTGRPTTSTVNRRSVTTDYPQSISTSLLPEPSKPSEAFNSSTSFHNLSSAHGFGSSHNDAASSGIRGVPSTRVDDVDFEMQDLDDQMFHESEHNRDNERPRLSFPHDSGFSPPHLSRVTLTYPDQPSNETRARGFPEQMERGRMLLEEPLNEETIRKAPQEGQLREQIQTARPAEPKKTERERVPNIGRSMAELNARWFAFTHGITSR